MLTLLEASDSFTLPTSFTSNSVIKFNVAQSGFFRVQYDKKLFDAVGNAIEQVSDVWNVMVCG